MEGNVVVVIGLARSGIAAAEFLARRGATVVAADAKAESALPPEALGLRERGGRLRLWGELAEDLVDGPAVVRLDYRHDVCRALRGDGVLEPGQLIRHDARQHINANDSL